MSCWNIFKHSFRKFSTLLVFGVFLFAPFVVEAQGSPAPPAATEITQAAALQQLGGELTLQQKKDLEDRIGKSRFSAFAVAYKNALKYFLNTIAIDSATWIASGRKGQKPLWETRGWGPYLTEVGGGAFGTALDTVAAEWDKAAQQKADADALTVEVQKQQVEISVLEDQYPAEWGQLPEEERNAKIAERETKIVELKTVQAPLIVRRDTLQHNATVSGAFFGGSIPTKFGQIYGQLKTQICNPSPGARLNITLGLASLEKPPPPSCTWQQMNQNWATLTTEDREQTLNRLSVAFDPGKNDISGTFQLFEKTIAHKEIKQQEAEQQRAGEERQGGLRVYEKLTGAFSLPPTLVKMKAEKDLLETDWPYGVFTGEALADAVGTFTNTLSSKVTERLFKKGMTWLLKQADEHDEPSTRNPTAVTKPSTTTTQAAIRAGIGIPAAIGSLANYDYVDDFTACPSDAKARSVLNCVMDIGFANAVTGEGRRGLLSLKEALDQKLMNGNLPFGYKDPANGTQVLAPEEGYSYSHTSIKKLRLARIVPVGWEFAAEKILATKKRRTLNEVMSCFVDKDAPNDETKPDNPTCHVEDTDINGDGKIDSNDKNKNSFYRLVDPNWILKSPKRSCPALAYSATLVAGTDQRHKLCVDAKDCVAEDSQGKCVASGYCTREKNVFRFTGQQCSPQFDTCQTFTKIATPGGTGEQANLAGTVQASRGTPGEQVTYLQNSIKDCPSDAAGCRWYSTTNTKDANGAIVWNATGKKYFNRNIQPCDPKFEGCREFRRLPAATGVASPTDVEKARTDALTSGRYPGSIPSLYLNGKRASCSVQEVGCESYTLAKGKSDPISAVVGSGDLCPRECAGYNQYRQVGTNFERGLETYFIPESAETCTAANKGCDEFTNLDVLAKGGEEKEFFTGLRFCEKPAADAKTFVTIEITEEGQQPIRWDMKTSNLDQNIPCTKYNAATGQCVDDAQTNLNLGTPKENGRGICSEAEAASDADCRRFVEPVGGTIAWRFLSRTITTDDECHLYRKESSQTNCTETGGKWDNNVCTYNAFAPGDASYKPHIPRNQSCPRAENGCREYKGPGAGNVRDVFRSTFDTSDTDGWTGQAGDTVISPTALQQGGKSLRTTVRIQKNVGERIQKGNTYLLSFFGRADDIRDGRVSIGFTGGGQEGQFIRVALTGGWRQYEIGPVPVTWDVGANELLEIGGFAATAYFDTITLKEITEDFFLIKNSWTTSASCETDLTLNPTLDPSKPHYAEAPGYMAGCKLYRDRKKNEFPLKPSLTLCQKEVVGCEALIDTQNSNTPKGKSDVYTDQTYDDTADDSVTFVVNDVKNACPAAEKGCTAFGLPKPEADGRITYITTTLRDNPERYAAPSDLCRSEHLGCEEFTVNRANQGQTHFFDPKVRGDSICEWKETPQNPEISDWFVKGTNDLCPVIGIKECPTQESGCTQFYEPIGRTAYYLLNNDDVDRTCTQVDWKAGCVLFDQRSYSFRGKRADSLAYNSDASPGPTTPGGPPKTCTEAQEFEKRCTEGEVEKLGKSCEGGGNVDCGENGQCERVDVCDANTILKVERDRVCGEWLQCISRAEGYDPLDQKTRELCYGVGRCQGVQKGNTTQCAQWAPADASPTPLLEASYKTRDVSWAGKEYSGYSIPKLYPIDGMRQRSYGTDATGRPIDFRLSFFLPTTQECDEKTPCPRGQECRTKEVGKKGKCYRDVGVDGLNPQDGSNTNGTRKKTCRGYPEINSPFPSKVVVAWQKSRTDECSVGKEAECQSNNKTNEPLTYVAGFNDVSVAQKGEDAECRYQKVEYQGVGTKYYGVRTEPPAFIPRDNDQKGKLTKRTPYLGWTGYCLERDLALPLNGEHPSSAEKACLTWWPIDLVEGEIDIFNTVQTAGYTPADLKQSYYCVETAKQEYRVTYSVPECRRKPPGCPSGYWPASYYECSKSSGHARRRYNCVTPEGWYQYDGLQGAERERTICTKVARVHDETDQEAKNVGWTSRLNATIQDRIQFAIKDLAYLYAQKVAPFGALAAPSQSRPDSSEWNTELVIQEQGKPDYQDGSAYAFLPDTITKGKDRLGDVFAKSYGIWTFSPGKQCVKQCQGGSKHGEPCSDPSKCEAPADLTGSCVDYTKKCLDGVNEGGPCNPDKDCTGANAYCDVRTKKCVGGTNPDAPCDPDKDCLHAAVNGTCVQAVGETEWKCTGDPAIEGMECPSMDNAECSISAENAKGLCVSSYGTTDPLRRDVKYCDGGGSDGDACGNKSANFCMDADNGTCEPPSPDCQPGGKGFTLDVGQCNAATSKCVGGSKNGTACVNNTDCTWEWDLRSAKGQPPFVKQVLFTGQDTREGEFGFTVDRVTNGTVGGETTGGVLPVNLTFYAYNENGEHMPLRRVMVDWGDNTEYAIINGSFKNHKGDCRRFCSNSLDPKDISKRQACVTDSECVDPSNQQNAGTCLPMTFGDLPEACVEDSKGADGTTNPGHFSFLHVYNCFKNNTTDTTPCEFIPRVQVMDNWGWCSGTCETKSVTPSRFLKTDLEPAAVPVRGCYDDGVTQTTYPVVGKIADLRCSNPKHPDYPKAWMVFPGKVIVKPALPSDIFGQ